MDKRLLGKVVCVVAVVAVAALAADVQMAAARWTNKDNWRQKLKVGMSPAAVKKILGEPAYEKTDMGGMVYYYQTFSKPRIVDPGPINPTDTKSPKEYLGYEGNVYFSTMRVDSDSPGKPRKGVLIATKWEEPSWGEIASPLPGERLARKPPVPTRKLEKWEVDGNWRRLSSLMDQKTVESIIGRPTTAKEDAFAVHAAGHLYVEWQYGSGNAAGSVKFMGPQDSPKGTLKCYEWREPFWPVVEATFRVDPNEAGEG